MADLNYGDLYARSLAEPAAFWAEQAGRLTWFTTPQNILSQDEQGFYRWFADGEMNSCYLALDHHVINGRGDQVALIYDSPVTQTVTSYTYRALLDEVSRFAGLLQHYGVGKGDRVILYMPMIPQAAIAMLACARIGAVHSVVFGGFAAHELAMRIDDAEPKLLLTASVGIEIDKIIPYLPLVQAAIEEAAHKVSRVLVWQRDISPAAPPDPLFHDWAENLEQFGKKVDCQPLAATDPLYILYTSGTTGKPKGIVRDNGGHAVALRFSMHAIYDIQPGDVFWAASDVGWVVGHSYIVYAPLMTGCTTILYEGKPIRTPDAGAFWRVVEQHRVKVLFTAPTGFRAIKKEDPDGLLFKKYDISSLQYLFLAGERCDVATLNWAENLLGIPVIDHWWQTESGWPMLANPAGLGLMPVVPGSAGKPVPGFDVQVLHAETHEPCMANEEGAVVVKLPMPPGCLPTLWQNPERFRAGYLDMFPGYYFTGDGGYINEEGYVFITGRIDDVINVAGHRLSTAEMEEIVAAHTAVAECAVIGVEDALKGQVPVGFVVLKSGIDLSDEALSRELAAMIRDKIGPIACFKQAIAVQRLPKTRSGKILRRIMRCIADDKPYQAPSTIEDISVLGEIGAAWRSKKATVA
jgi:acyl-coenzyme A synthetase/AMP-(fatty) acid ligase